MGSPNISSSKQSKCSLTNKHVRIIRNLAEKKNLMMSSPLTDSCSKSYLAAMEFWRQKVARPTLLAHKYLAVSTEFCEGLALSLPSVC